MHALQEIRRLNDTNSETSKLLRSAQIYPLQPIIILLAKNYTEILFIPKLNILNYDINVFTYSIL